MKKFIGTITILLTVLALAACSSASANSTSQATKSAASSTTASPNNGLPTDLELIIGTFKLEGSANQVDAQMATTLLPLWKAVKTLSSSSTTAPAELTALYKQIQGAMKPEQISAITAMHLTMADMNQVAQDKGITIGGGVRPTMTAEQQAAAQASRQSGQNSGSSGPGGAGGGPGGAPPSGGGPLPSGGSMPAGDPGAPGGQTNGTSINGTTTTQARPNMSSAFYDALINLLETRASGK